MSSPLTVIYEFDRFRLDKRNQRLTRDGLLMTATGRTLPILIDLIDHRDQVVTVEKLVDSHFPRSSFGEEELTSEILKLKRLLDDTSKQAPMVRFVLGQGYQFEAEVTEYLGDAASDQKFGAEKESTPPPSVAPPKSKSNGVLGMIAALVAIVALALGVWKYLPVKAGGNDSSDSTEAFTGTPKVAILPFQSLTGQASDEGFNRSLTEGILAALSKQPQLEVVPTAEVQKYLESGVADPVTAGRQLGAQMIVHGMAQRLAGHIVVKVQLVSTQDGSQIWSTSFEGNANDIAGLTAKISEKIGKGAGPA